MAPAISHSQGNVATLLRCMHVGRNFTNSLFECNGERTSNVDQNLAKLRAKKNGVTLLTTVVNDRVFLCHLVNKHNRRRRMTWPPLCVAGARTRPDPDKAWPRPFPAKNHDKQETGPTV